MRVQVPYIKTRFYNDVINQKTYLELREKSREQVIQEFKYFREKQISEFNADYKTERMIFRITYPIVLMLLASMILMFSGWVEEDSFLYDFLVYPIIIGFIGFFIHLASYSYSLSLSELKKGLRIRKRNLLKAQKAAKQADDFNEFLSLIVTKRSNV